MTTAARPRPKPRKKVSDQSSQPSSSSNVSQAPKDQKIVDEDEHFFLHRNRTADNWRKIQEVAKAQEVIDVDEDNSEDEDDRPKSPRKKKAGKSKSQTKLPDWQEKLRKLTPEIISDDDDIQITGESSSRRKGGSKSPLKRKRSRSRSITPPPDVSASKLQALDNIVRQAFDSGRPKSPVIVIPSDSDDDDPIDLDPELKRIAQKVSLKPRAQSYHRGSSIDVASSDVEEYKPEVKLRVRWIPHPNNSLAKEQIHNFKMYTTDNFTETFDNIADITGSYIGSLVVTYKGQRIFPSATPKAFNMRGSAELEACEKQTYEYLREQRGASPFAPSSAPQSKSDKGPSRSSSPGLDEAGSDDDAAAKIRLILRSAKSSKDITLTVRSTATCGAIVQAFMKSAGLTGNASKARISVDGDKLDNDSEIGEAELEDGDMVEVVGL